MMQTMTSKDKGTNLREASSEGNVDEVKKLIAAKANLEDRDAVPPVASRRSRDRVQGMRMGRKMV